MSLLAGKPIESSAHKATPSNTSMHPYGPDDNQKSVPSRQQILVPPQKRWGIILAGGDGTRLNGLTRLISGDGRPKQFCRLVGRQTLLEQTRQRAAKSIPLTQTIIALTQTHENYFEADSGQHPSPRLIQPCNRGTAPPIILSLLHIADQTPNATVAILPSDHYYSDEAAFTSSLETAFQLVHHDPDSIVLLGAQPKGPAVDFGWIDLGSLVNENIFRVRGFVEKPQLAVAEQLFRSGALWNTFVMVGSALAFLWMIFVTVPEVMSRLEASLPLSNERGDLRVSPEVYETISAVDFSRQVLTPSAHRLRVLRLQQSDWHDLGHPDRVISVVRSRGESLPAWIHAWERVRRTA